MIALRDVLRDGLDIIRSYWFDAFEPDRRERKEDFYGYLEVNGYRVDAQPLRRRNGELIEKGTDIDLATAMLTGCFTDSYEVAILVSGDADFTSAIRVIEDRGKRVVVAGFDETVSWRLERIADEFVSLTAVADEIAR